MKDFMTRTHLNSDLMQIACTCAEVSSKVSVEYHKFHFQRKGRGGREGIGIFFKFREYLEHPESVRVPFIPLSYLHLPMLM